MNRTQRRAAMRAEKRRKHMPQQAQPLQSGPMQIQHGHTDEQVLVQFSRPCDHILLTPEQADAFCAAVQNSKAMLAAHRARKGN